MLLTAMKNRKWFASNIIIFSVMIVLGLTACSDKGSTKELKKFVSKVKLRQPPPIEPLPESRLYPKFKYSAHKLRSPFRPYNSGKNKKTKGYLPDQNRIKEPLETYPIDALKMVGILKKGDDSWGLVVAPDGNIHTVKKGQHMGQNYGKIIGVYDGEIELLETIRVNDEWRQRKASVKLENK